MLNLLENQNVVSTGKIIFLLIILFSISKAEDKIFNPPIAAQIEARIGTYYLIDDDKMRLDIGNSFDLMKLYENDNIQINTGADLMTFTRLRSVGKFKFPVETTDYYFGLNSTFVQKTDSDKFFSGRIRIAHISSHLIDGLAKDGIFTQMPYVYSREFVDLIGAYNMHLKDRVKLKFYAGANFIFSTIPDEVNKIEPQIGVDIKHKIFNPNLEFVIALDHRLLGQNNVYRGSNSIQTGLNYTTSENTSMFIGYYFFSGHSIHGMFYSENDQYHGLGIQLYY